MAGKVNILTDEVKEFYLLAMKFNNHKDIHIMQEAGRFLKSAAEAKAFGLKIMDLRMVFVYKDEQGKPYHKMVDELTAKAKKYSYLLPYGFEIYKCNKDAGEMSMKSVMLLKGK